MLVSAGKDLGDDDKMGKLADKLFKNVIGLDVANEKIAPYIHGKTLKDVASMLKNGKAYFTKEIDAHFKKATPIWNNADNKAHEDLDKEFNATIAMIVRLKTKNTIITKAEASELLQTAKTKYQKAKADSIKRNEGDVKGEVSQLEIKGKSARITHSLHQEAVS